MAVLHRLGGSGRDRGPVLALSVGSLPLKTATFAFWRSRGLSNAAAAVVTNAGCATVSDVLAKGRAHFAAIPGCGPAMLRSIEVTIGGWQRQRPQLERLIQRAAEKAVAGGSPIGGAVIDALLEAGFSIQRDLPRVYVEAGALPEGGA